jgi:hypothetical protein
MTIPRFLARGAAGAVLLTTAFGIQVAMTAPPSAPSVTVTIDPVRILDTREPIGVPAVAKVAGGTSISVVVAGDHGIPADATGVVLTLTGTGATSPTFVSATPTGTPRSTTSVLNVTPGQDIADTITIGIGAGGKIDLYNNAGSIDLVADVTGYLLPANAPHIETTTIDVGAYAGAGRNGAAPKGLLPENLGCVHLDAGDEVFVDIPLPFGAAIKEVDFRYFDTGPGNMTFLLFEVDTAGTTATIGGTLADNQTNSTGNGGFGTATITPVGGDAVSDTVRYYIDMFSGGGGPHSYCGANVTYQRVVS